MEEYEPSLRAMTGRIAGILSDCGPTIYLYGSVPLCDFRPGWSDIDILVLTEKPIKEAQAGQLLNLRQAMLAEEPGNPYYRSFEGGMLSLDGFLNHTPDTVVYWGTSGQRLTDRYVFDVFCMAELLKYGVLLWGNDVRGRFRMPDMDELRVYRPTMKPFGGIPGLPAAACILTAGFWIFPDASTPSRPGRSFPRRRLWSGR